MAKIAFDVDWTLVNNDQSLNHEMVEELLRWLKRGHDIIIWSGGGHDYAKHQGTKILGKFYMDIYNEKVTFSSKTKENAAMLNPDICYDDEVVNLARVNIYVSNMAKIEYSKEDMQKCHQCGTALVPDPESVIYGTTDWDGHTYKFNCSCVSHGLRVSIG